MAIGSHEKRLHKGSRFKERSKIAKGSTLARYLWLWGSTRRWTRRTSGRATSNVPECNAALAQVVR